MGIIMEVKYQNKEVTESKKNLRPGSAKPNALAKVIEKL